MSEETMSRAPYPSEDKRWLRYYNPDGRENDFPRHSLYDQIYANNCDEAGSIALNYFDKRISYKELFSLIDAAAKAYWRLGVRPGDVVIISSVNTPEVIASIYALNRLGAIINLVDPRSPLDAITRYLLEGKSEYVLCLDRVYPLIKKAAADIRLKGIVTVSIADSLPVLKRVAYAMRSKKVTLDSGAIKWEKFIAEGKDAEPEYPTVKSEECAVMAHTGGTTGVPKTVLLSADNLNAVSWGFRYLGVPLERGQRYYNDLPPFIIYGLSHSLHSALSYGLEIIINPEFNSQKFPKRFIKHKPNHFSALAGHLKYLLEDPEVQRMDLSFLMTAAVGGDSLNEELERRANKFLEEHNCKYEVVKGFGMTELSATSICSFDGANAIGSIGIPFITNTIKIVDPETKTELGYNEDGELWISGPSIMLGYLDMIDETAERISVEPDGTRWLHTGDLGHISEEGLVFIEGRLRRMYLSVRDNFPAKIYPNIIEKAIKKHKDVFDCCAVGVQPDGCTYYDMIAFVIKNSADIDESELTAELFELAESEIPTKMQPTEFRYISEFPLTKIGKVDYRALETLAASCGEK